jgi:hypothetical protein
MILNDRNILFSITKREDVWRFANNYGLVKPSVIYFIIEMIHDKNKCLLNIKADNEYIREFAKFLLKCNKKDLEKYDIIHFRRLFGMNGKVIYRVDGTNMLIEANGYL